MKLHLLKIYIWRHSWFWLIRMFYIVVDFLFIIIGGLDLFMVFVYYVYLFIYILIRKLYLLEMMVSEIMLLDWLIKLKRSVISVLSILNCLFYRRFSMSVTWYSMYFMYPSMFCQFNVYNIIEEPGRIYLPGTLELPTFISKLLLFMRHTLAFKNFKLVISWDSWVYILRTVYASDIWMLIALCLTFSCNGKRANPLEQFSPPLVTALYNNFLAEHLYEFLQEQCLIQWSDKLRTSNSVML